MLVCRLISIKHNYLFVAAEEAMPGAVPSEVHTPDELAGLTPEQAEQLRAEWSRELARVEDEIATLRTVLQSKVHKQTRWYTEQSE